MTPVQTTKMSNFRWVICGLLFLATTINYMDRQVLSLTWKDFIAPDFHWTDSDYGTITGMFSLFYAIANLFAGKFIDWMGTKSSPAVLSSPSVRPATSQQPSRPRQSTSPRRTVPSPPPSSTAAPL